MQRLDHGLGDGGEDLALGAVVGGEGGEDEFEAVVGLDEGDVVAAGAGPAGLGPELIAGGEGFGGEGEVLVVGVVRGFGGGVAM